MTEIHSHFSVRSLSPGTCLRLRFARRSTGCSVSNQCKIQSEDELIYIYIVTSCTTCLLRVCSKVFAALGSGSFFLTSSRFTLWLQDAEFTTMLEEADVEAWLFVIRVLCFQLILSML